MADPVADKSGFLCTYMSTHPDTLVAYVKHFGNVDGHVSSAKMLSIDSKVRSSPPHTHGYNRDKKEDGFDLLGNGLGIQDEGLCAKV